MIRQGNCLSLFPDYRNKVDLLIADPPYNIGEPYEKGDSMTLMDFNIFTDEWIKAAVPCLKDAASMWIIIPTPMLPVVMTQCTNQGLRLVNDVIWHYRFGPHGSKKFIPSHVHCLWYCREGAVPLFNFEAVMEASDRATRYNDQRTYLKMHTPSGMRPPFDVWEIPRVTGNSKERVPECPNQLPENLVHRIIAACSTKVDLILDPFAGSGTTISVAQRMGREAVGFELGETTAQHARNRIERDKGKIIGHGS